MENSKYCLIIVIVLATTILGCNKDELGNYKTNEFVIQLLSGEIISFHNQECEFNNLEHNQAQFNYTSSVGYSIFSTYWNPHSMDSTINQIWIDLLLVPDPPHELYDIDKLRTYLRYETNSDNNEHIFVNIQMEVYGQRYDNRLRDSDPNTPPWEINDALQFQINEYDFFYSTCNKRELLYIDMTISGKLYHYDFLTIEDSIQIHPSQLKLLFETD